MPDSHLLPHLPGSGVLQSVATLQGHTDKVSCCSFSRDGIFLATGGHDKSVFVFNTRNYSVFRTFLGAHTYAVTDVAFSKRTNTIASCSLDKTIRLWDLERERDAGQLLSTPAPLNSIDFHPDRDNVLASSDASGDLRFWDLTRAQLIHGMRGALKHVRFEPNRGMLLAAAHEASVNVIDVDNSRNVHTLVGHTKPVVFVSWSRDGRLVASASEDSVCLHSMILTAPGPCLGLHHGPSVCGLHGHFREQILLLLFSGRVQRICPCHWWV